MAFSYCNKSELILWIGFVNFFSKHNRKGKLAMVQCNYMLEFPGINCSKFMHRVGCLAITNDLVCEIVIAVKTIKRLKVNFNQTC